MANYYSMGRTNYFAVKDEQRFKDTLVPLIESHDGEVWEEKEDGITLYGIGFGNGDSAFPTYHYDEETGDEYEIDWVTAIGEHLADGHVCIMQEIGWEKLRYLAGYATAFDNTGKTIGINLYNIVAMAQEAFGCKVTVPEY